ncbi:MAG: hypothetical protein V3T23_13965 [Nitrososphaerales archaeon]
MKKWPFKISVFALPLFLFLVSCSLSTFEAGREIMSGRDALLLGNPQAALPSFEAISQANPDYINCINLFCVGIWTYLGRTQHEIGKNEWALASPMKGKRRHRGDRFNQIYLGLVKARTGKIEEGKAELDVGLEALHNWLANLWRQLDGDLWDTRGLLRKVIVDIRNQLQSDRISWDRVDQSVRQLALEFEEEGRGVLDDKDVDARPLLES